MSMSVNEFQRQLDKEDYMEQAYGVLTKEILEKKRESNIKEFLIDIDYKNISFNTLVERVTDAIDSGLFK